jgi:tetratricopeptide (TPR) repeat protein
VAEFFPNHQKEYTTMDKSKLIADLELALSEKNQSQLEELAKTAVSKFPEEAFGYAFLADYFLMEEPANYPKAEICLVKAMDYEADNVQYMLKFAAMKERQGDFENARIMYLKVLKKDAQNQTALTNLGLYELRVSKLYEKAEDYLKAAYQQDEDEPKLNHYLAELYYEKEDLESALIHIGKAFSKDFDEAITVMLIKILDALGDREQVLKLYDMLVTKLPDAPNYRFEFGQQLYDAKVFGEAITQTRKGIELSEGELDVVFYEPILKSLFILERHDELIQELNGLIEKDPDDSDLYIQLANAYFAKEDFKKALENYAKVIELVEDENLNLQYRKRKGFLHLRIGEVKEAIDTFTEMLDHPIFAPTGNYGMGYTAFAAGKMEKAYEHLKAAKLKGNQEAEKFIYEKMLDYLNETKASLLKEHEGALAKNADSAFIQKISGQLWQFESMDSKALEGQSEMVLETINKSLKSFSILFTEKGGLMVKAVHADPIAYKILKEDGDAVQLQITNLDGTKVYEANLSLEAGLLCFSEKEGEVLKFKKASLEQISVPVLKAYRRTLIADEIAFLGEKAQPVVDTFFQTA